MAIMPLLEKKLLNLFSFLRKIGVKQWLKDVPKIKGTVLELGCGNGTTTIELAKKLPNCRIVAVDYDPEQVILARKNIAKHSFSKQVKVFEADAMHLKFKKNYFSAVFAFLTFHHLENWQKAVKEVFRVLKSNGKFFVEEMALKPFPRLKHFLFPAEGIFTKQEFIDQLKKVGFTEIFARGNWDFWLRGKK